MLEVDIKRLFYPGKEVLSAVRFDLAPGTLNVLIGPNGSGKTTLLKALTGLHEGWEGHVLYNGHDLREMPDESLGRQVAVVLTDPVVTPMTVWDVLASGRFPYVNRFYRLTDEDYRRLEEVSEKWNLKPYWHQKITDLSDGERQRVMIGRALVQDAPVLILDEPDTHLDIMHRAELLAGLKQIAGEGKTVLLSTHYLDLFFDVADRLLITRNGTVWTGNPDEAVDEGILEEVFSGKLLTFDKEKRQFKWKRPWNGNGS